MVTHLGVKVRTARKQHTCEMCQATIAVGERYRVSTNILDGRVYDWRECLPCVEDKICDEVFAWAGDPDEGVGYDSAWEWAHEHEGAEGVLGEMAQRWLTRANCQCERCEHGRAEAIAEDRGCVPENDCWAECVEAASDE